MNPEDAVDLGREALRTCLMVGGPILAVGLVIGLLVGVLQAMTQIQDQAVSFVPRILVMMVAIGIALPWLAQRMVDFTAQSFESPYTSLSSQTPVFIPPDRGFRKRTSPREDREPSADVIAGDRPSSAMPILQTPVFQAAPSMPTMTNPAPSSMPMMGSGNFVKPVSPRIADVAAGGADTDHVEAQNR